MKKPTTPTVYIIDDDDELLQALRWLIESIRVPVETFSSAKKFLKDYKPNMQGCLIADVYIPEMSGLELQEQLAKNAVTVMAITVKVNGMPIYKNSVTRLCGVQTVSTMPLE